MDQIETELVGNLSICDSSDDVIDESINESESNEGNSFNDINYNDDDDDSFTPRTVSPTKREKRSSRYSH